MTYLVIYKFSSKALLKKLGEEAREANELRYKSIIETFSGIKEIKINGLEKVFVKRYSDPAQNFAKTFAKSRDDTSPKIWHRGCCIWWVIVNDPLSND